MLPKTIASAELAAELVLQCGTPHLIIHIHGTYVPHIWLPHDISHVRNQAGSLYLYDLRPDFVLIMAFDDLKDKITTRVSLKLTLAFYPNS
jgi:hypothetical protein